MTLTNFLSFFIRLTDLPELSQTEIDTSLQLDVPLRANSNAVTNTKAKTNAAARARANAKAKQAANKDATAKKEAEAKPKTITNDDSCDCSKEAEAAAIAELVKCVPTKERKD